MVAFPAIAHWVAGEGLASERDRALRSDIVTFAFTTAICAAFLALALRPEPRQCSGPVDSLFGHCIAASQAAASQVAPPRSVASAR